ncbi:GntR family transcriptional regulator [Agrococcus terreus]|uniref:Transcriptional regulator, GntR family protein n=1 Tax=Agrococcus terreus TaxID=574649 RepID=A0ABQ2KB86_9MICO|nr:GntR family transcriptional regulator [Agrococcus terreus]GGN77796.1 putative transcriptional regulator, GntR family protein [Agrococcus terreus]
MLPPLAELGRLSLREQALAALRRAISSGSIQPGTRMVEADLSTQLGISRGTLREAMRQLQQDGLLEADARGRLSVRQIGHAEIVDIFLVRGALEALAVRTICGFGDREPALAAVRTALEGMSAPTQEQIAERIEADLDFHRTLVRASGNGTLLHQWTQLEGSIRMSIMFAGAERALRNMDVDRHREIVDAIEAGDGDEAARVLREHMHEAATTLIG